MLISSLSPRTSAVTANSCGEGSSLRVRLRMFANQSSCVRARISSTGSSISSICTAPNPNLATTSSSFSPSIYQASCLKSTNGGGQRLMLEKCSNKFSISQQNLEYQRVDQTLRVYDPKISASQHQLSSPTTLPIRIGFSDSNTNDSYHHHLHHHNHHTAQPYKSSTVKTFRLTENLQSNIRFDVTLKPSMSIRDNRLDPSLLFNSNHKMTNPSMTNTECDALSRSSSCDIFTPPCELKVIKKLDTRSSSSCKVLLNKSENFENSEIEEEEEEHQIDLPIDSTYRISREKVTHLPYRTNIPLNSSITFKIRNLNLFGAGQSQSCPNASSKRHFENTARSNPFAFIETYSARKSPPTTTNQQSSNKRVVFC